MASIWAESVVHGLEQALDLLSAAVADCPDELWEAAMWPVAAPGPGQRIAGPHGRPVTSAAERSAIVQRHSTPWSIAWHALECFDYDLNGEFGPWAPPPPFAGHAHWRDLTSLAVAWSRPQVLGYIDYCRRQARDTLAGMTEERAATPLPTSHRYGGQPHAAVVVSLIVHTAEHASQTRQFITAARDRFRQP